ncbi:MAG: MCE family protein [Actinobacteria bacterium]|nr:MCE family protein [Actinomycetota bacterium]
MIPGFRWTAVKLGIFTIVTLIVTSWLAAIIGNFQFFASPYTITAQFEDATGLLQGDVVKAAGVTIGRVEEISVDEGMALVELSIDEGTELPAGVGAEVRFRNLIGQRMISLVEDPESSVSGLLQDGDLIPLERTEPAFDLSILFNGLRPLIRSTSSEDINIVTKEVLAALKGREDVTASLFTNLADISDTLASKDQELDVLLEGVTAVTSNLSSRDAQLRASLEDMGSFLTDLSASREDLRGALVNLDVSARKLGQIVRDNDELIEAEIDDLAILLDAINDRRDDLRKIVKRLPTFLEAVQRTTNYGEWGNQHLINVCRDDSGTCGTRYVP